MSDVYMYQAALYCAPCGHDLPACPNPDCDDTDHDSDEYRTGPYPDGGGESDSPDHCDDCRVFLENPLTHDGFHYVIEQLIADSCLPPEWADHYRAEIDDYLETDRWANESGAREDTFLAGSTLSRVSEIDGRELFGDQVWELI